MKTFLGVLISVAVIVAAGFVYLSQKDIPAPTTHVEKSLDDRFDN